MKKPRRPSNVSEARRTNVLLEAMRKEVHAIAEGQNGLSSELDTVKAALRDVGEDVKRMKPIVESLAPVPKKLENIEKRLESFDERLKVVEAKVPS